MVKIGTPMTPVGKKAILCGSGELGKEVALELQRFGVEVVALDRYTNAPAMQVAHRSYVLSMLDGAKLREIIEAEKPDFIIPEVEAIATPTLVELEKEGYKDSVKFCFTDVRNEDEVKQLVDHTVETFGGLDIFVNSAAIWNYAKVYDLPKEDLQLVFETNVYGAFYGVKHVSRYMIDHEVRGKIVLISSNSPIMPYPVFGGYPHYASSKAAVMGLTTEAAKELKRYGIMINSIAPGGMVTPGAAGNLASENISEEKQDEFYEELMIWQVDGQLPVDQVGMMAYTFCTDVADGITGETVVVDGGATHNIVKYQVAIDAFPEEG